MADQITVRIDGQSVRVPEGVSVAAAVLMAGRTRFRISVSGEPRAPLCGMGICFECRVTIDSRPHGRSCQMVARDGMVIET